MTLDERAQQAQRAAELRAAKERRLHQLRLQAAELGLHTPPHVLTEIDQLEHDLAALAAVAHPPVGEDVRRLLRRYDQLDLVTNTLAAAIGRLTRLEEAFDADRQLRSQRQTAVDRQMRALFAGLLTLTALILALMFLLLVRG
jgi:hypothetical protein